MATVRYLTLSEILNLYHHLMEASGGKEGIRDWHGLLSALAQPRMQFEGQDLYPTLAEKAGALAYSLAQNHPFIDGNKRLAHAAMEVFLVLNGYEIKADPAAQEEIMLQLAAGKISRETFIHWVKTHLAPL